MFSSKELLHFVFANENDTYYCNELLAPNLNQYLWLKLHEQGYGCVYFLELDDDDYQIRTFGDTLAQSNPSDSVKIWGFSKQKQKNALLRKWFLKQLAAKGPSRSAVVCSLKDFCEFFESEEWTEFLSELVRLEKRTGILILTAPTEAEGSRRYFLRSPVFDRMGEHSVTSLRRAYPCDMYRAMSDSKPGRTVYLNNYTPGRVHSLITRQFVSDPRRCDDCTLQDHMEDYLLQWMNNPSLRSAEVLTTTGFPQPDAIFLDAYAWLQKDDNWEKLVKRAKQVADAGGIQSYVRALGCPLAEGRLETVNISRAHDSYAWQCMQLSVPRDFDSDPREQERISKLLEEIRKEVSAPKNREESAEIVKAVNRFLTNLHAPATTGDAGTYRRILYSIRFCVQWICADKNSAEEKAILKVVDILRNYVECSSKLFERERDLAWAKNDLDLSHGSASGLMRRVIEDKETETDLARRVLASYESVVQTKVAEMSRASSAAISDLAKRLSESLNHELESVSEDIEKALVDAKDNQPEQEPEQKQEQEQEADLPDDGKEPAEETEYVLTDEDFGFNMFYIHK